MPIHDALTPLNNHLNTLETRLRNRDDQIAMLAERVTRTEESIAKLADTVAKLSQATNTTAPPTGLIEMRGDPTFNTNNLDATTTDEHGITAFQWYQRTIASLERRNLDTDFDRNDNRPWNRTGNQHVTLLLALFRHTGDMFLLDDSVRLMELAWGRMSTSGGRRFWAGHDQILDTVLGAGLVAAIMWACHHNRDLTSPAGHNYGAIADKYHAWLVDDFIPCWANSGTLVLNKKQQHTWVNGTRLLHYVGRMGGGGGFTAAQYFAERDARMDHKFDTDVTGPIGHEGRTCLVYKHLTDGTSNSGESTVPWYG